MHCGTETTILSARRDSGSFGSGRTAGFACYSEKATQRHSGPEFGHTMRSTRASLAPAPPPSTAQEATSHVHLHRLSSSACRRKTEKYYYTADLHRLARSACVRRVAKSRPTPPPKLRGKLAESRMPKPGNCKLLHQRQAKKGEFTQDIQLTQRAR